LKPIKIGKTHILKMKKIVFLLLFCFQGILAQVQFIAKASKSSLGMNQTFRIDFMMNDDGDNFVPPSFEGFRIVGGPNQSVSYQWVNGRKSFDKTYSYYLMPTRKGSFLIKPASIEIGNQIYKSNPVKIAVGDPVAEERDPYGNPNAYYPQQQQQVPTYVGKEGVQLVAEISNLNPYLNEPITVVYKIYVNARTSVRDWKEVKNPKYADFWSQNIEIKQLSVQQQKFQGEDYRYVVLKKAVLYPQKSGKLEIEPLSLNVQVEIPTNERDFFGSPIMTIGTKLVSAGTKIINVKPLPEAGKPEGFSGAVGSFDFKVTPTKTKLKNGESTTLNVSVSGKGNLKLFMLPKPEAPASIEIYDPVHKENITTPITGTTGNIEDQYTIVPQFKGVFPIKPIVFSYFDLTSKTYKSISSNQINIEALDGATPDTNVNTTKTAIKANTSFGFIKLKTCLIDLHKSNFLGSFLFYLLWILPFFMVPVLIFYKKKKEESDGDIAGNKIKKSNRLAKKYLSEAKLHLANKEPFYVALEKSMHNFLKAKLNIETSEMSKEKISEILISRNANPKTISEFINLTENCEFARYAPSTKAEIQLDYDKAVVLISDLEKQIK
jgi:BatD DUF11 like domain